MTESLFFSYFLIHIWKIKIISFVWSPLQWSYNIQRCPLSYLIVKDLLGFCWHEDDSWKKHWKWLIAKWTCLAPFFYLNNISKCCENSYVKCIQKPFFPTITSVNLEGLSIVFLATWNIILFSNYLLPLAVLSLFVFSIYSTIIASHFSSV